MTQTVTTGEGRAYVFIAVDYCSGGVRGHSCLFEPDTALGLILPNAHGPNHMSDTSQSEIACFRINSLPAFMRQPEGKGVAEPAIRTLKDQPIWVRNFATVENLRQALAEFAARYGCENGMGTSLQIKSWPNKRPLHLKPQRGSNWRQNKRKSLSQNRATE